jgi:hypothetical protein
MRARNEGLNWRFVGQWLLAGAVGIILFGVLGVATIWSIGEAVERATSELAGFVVMGLVFGALVALGTSLGPGLLLRSRGVSPRRWIGWSVLAGAIGMGIAFVLLQIFVYEGGMDETVIGPILGICLGLPLGLGQWRALADHPNAGLWPAIAVLSFVVATVTGGGLINRGLDWQGLVAIALLASGLTGAGMGWLLQARTAAPT